MRVVRPWLADAVIATAILVSGAVVGASYRRVFYAAGALEVFGQWAFGAAVAQACGHGFVDPGPGLTPALDDFLHVKRDRLSCSDLPASLPPRPPDLTQGLYRYLMTTTALVWRVRGISWSGLTPLFGVLYGLTLVAAYGLFRLLVGRVMAVVATLLLMVSAVHLQSLPHLRDYAKAPFILALILMMGLIAMPPLRPRRALALAVAFGVTLGIGFGFRNDLLITVWPWIAAVLFCLPGPVRSSVRLKAACLAVSAAMFMVTAWPILAAYSRGSNSGHVLLLGLMSPFDASLGLEPSLYSWGYTYLDEYAKAVISGFGDRLYGHPVAFLSADYDRAGLVYVQHIVRHWPADMVTRLYGSVLKVIEFPFFVDAYAHAVPPLITNTAVLTFYGGEDALLKALKGWAVIDVAAALVIISAGNVRAALTLLLFLVYFAGYPALQFDVRHFFHLEFIAWAAFAFILERAAVWVMRAWHARHDLLRRDAWVAARRESARHFRNVAIFAAATVVLIVAPATVLRAYQTNHLETLLSRDYLARTREPLMFVAAPAADRRTAITVPALRQAPESKRNATEYLAIELSPAACDALYVSLAFRYEGYDGSKFDHVIDAPLVDGAQPTLVLSPIYYADTARFSRIEIPEQDAPCLTRLSRIVPSEAPDVLVDAVFTPHWRDQTLFQTIRDWETPSWTERLPNRYLIPATGPAPRRSPPRAFVVQPGSAEPMARIARQTADGSLVIRGRPETPESPIWVIKDQALDAGSTVIVRGVVRHGGVTVGAQRDNQWVKVVNVGTPGPFVVSMQVDTAGKYLVGLANFAHSGDNDVTISALGWLPPAGK